MQKIQLTVEEGLQYQKFEASLEGFADGVRATIEHLKRKRLEEIIREKQAAPPPTPDPQ